jgi:hypothetical protein
MTTLRSRKVGSCGLCSWWEYNSKDWGTCKAVNENSAIRGMELELEVPSYAAWLTTRRDFGCRLFQEMDIWKA